MACREPAWQQVLLQGQLGSRAQSKPGLAAAHQQQAGVMRSLASLWCVAGWQAGRQAGGVWLPGAMYAGRGVLLLRGIAYAVCGGGELAVGAWRLPVWVPG